MFCMNILSNIVKTQSIARGIDMMGWFDNFRQLVVCKTLLIEESLHKKRLIETLQANGIEAKGMIEFLGYDSPYKVYNRRNEVLVEIAYAD